MWLFKPKKSYIKERRRCFRTGYSLKVSYQIENNTPQVDCSTQNISELGMLLNVYQKLEIGASLKLCIDFQDDMEPLWFFGNVIWIKETPGQQYPYKVGIEFNFVPFSVRTKIKNYI